MKAMTFHEIRNTVHAICEEVDTNYDSDVDTMDAISESTSQYFIYHGDVWSAAAGMRFEYFDAWFDAEQVFEDSRTGLDIDSTLYAIVHECLRLLVEDAHANGDHLPEEE
jgi:hypothetical protein